ncbi:Hypothetical predicted protein [Pelobates cultripes]|uniref:Uncharacterized protein n=1 Tax=Pelobates cultripes TaxID=61616 RepID=A0AAD1WCH5_PELCU|nr:Hypothetical predicted protein [Pelobates cultripes]
MFQLPLCRRLDLQGGVLLGIRGKLGFFSCLKLKECIYLAASSPLLSASFCVHEFDTSERLGGGKKSHKSDRCIACDAKALEGKKLCSSCLSEAAGSPNDPSPDMIKWIQMAVDKSMEQHRSHKRPRISSQRDREDSDSDSYASFVDVQSEEGEGMYFSEDSASVEEHMDVKTIEKLIKAVRYSLKLEANLFKYLSRTCKKEVFLSDP